MATRLVGFRIDEGLLAWADAYGKQRGLNRSETLSLAVESLRGDAAGGVPEPEARKAAPDGRGGYQIPKIAPRR